MPDFTLSRTAAEINAQLEKSTPLDWAQQHDSGESSVPYQFYSYQPVDAQGNPSEPGYIVWSETSILMGAEPDLVTEGGNFFTEQIQQWRDEGDVRGWGGNIQSALDAKKETYAYGEFVTPNLTFNSLGSGNFRGGGFYNTTLKAASNSGSIIDTNGFSGVRISQMKLDGDGKSINGLHMNNTFYSLLEGLDVRNNDGYGYDFTNSNNNTLNNVSTHYTLGSGWRFDATSQHNTLNACGAEDWHGYGMEVRGIGNIFNAPWIENRNSDSFATDVAMLIANRDNIVLAPEIRSASSAKPLSRGIFMSADSGKTLLVNPHFDNCTQPIRLEGQDKYRILIGVNPSDVTDANGDDTTLIQNGNTVYSKFRHISDAPVIEYESQNGSSGVQYRIIGTASGAMFRWQLGLVTQVQIDNNGDFTPGTANTKRLGTGSKPFSESHVTKSYSTESRTTISFTETIRMTPLSSAPSGENGHTLAMSDGTQDGTFGSRGEGLYRKNTSGDWVFVG